MLMMISIIPVNIITATDSTTPNPPVTEQIGTEDLSTAPETADNIDPIVPGNSTANSSQSTLPESNIAPEAQSPALSPAEDAAPQSPDSAATQESSTPAETAVSPATTEPFVQAFAAEDSSSSFVAGYAKVNVASAPFISDGVDDAYLELNDAVYVEGTEDGYSLVHFRTAEGAVSGKIFTDQLLPLTQTEALTLIEQEKEQTSLLYYQDNTDIPLPLIELNIIPAEPIALKAAYAPIMQAAEPVALDSTVVLNLLGARTYNIGTKVNPIAAIYRTDGATALGPATVVFTIDDTTGAIDTSSIYGQVYEGALPTITTEGTVTTITYELSDVPANISANAPIQLPIFFTTLSTTTPGTTIPIHTSLQAGGNVVAEVTESFDFSTFDGSIDVKLQPYTANTYNYLTGMDSVINIVYEKSNTGSTIQEGRITFTLDNTYMRLFLPTAINSAYKTEIHYDPQYPNNINKATGVTYHFTQLSPGVSMTIPINVGTLPYSTPDGYPWKFTVRVTDADGNDITTPVTSTFTYNTATPQLRKLHNINRYVDYTTSSRVFGGFDSVNNATGEVGADGLIDQDGAVLQRFDYALFSSTPAPGGQSNYGARIFNPVTIVDTLPQGAVFDPAKNPGWAYVDGSNNTQVQYTKTTNTYFYNGTASTNLNVPLYLSFPGFNYANNSTVNTAKAILTPQNAQSYEYGGEIVAPEDSITMYFNTQTPTLNLTKTRGIPYILDRTTEKELEFYWILDFTNPSGGLSMEELQLNDFDLDPRLMYTGVRLYPYYTNQMVGPDGQVGTGTLTILALDENDTVLGTVAQNIPTSSSTIYRNIPAGTKKISIRADEGTVLPSNTRFYAYIYTKIADPANVHYTTYTQSFMRNYAQASYKWVGDSNPTPYNSTKSTASVQLREYNPMISLRKSIDNKTLLLDQATTVRLSLNETSPYFLMSPDALSGLKIIDLLPANVEYIPGSTTLSIPSTSHPDIRDALYNLEPEIIPNFRSDYPNRTALVWSFGPVLGHPAMSTATMLQLFTLNFKIKPTMLTEPGINTNTSYAIWQNNAPSTPEDTVQQIQPQGTTAADTLDLDGDGDITERVLTSSFNFDFVPPAELVVFKRVKGNLDQDFVSTGGKVFIGGKATYEVTVLNKSVQPATSITILDVLPAVGDKAIVPDINGNYAARGSSFPVMLTGPVQAPANFDVFYHTAAPSGKPGVYAADANWVSTVDDWSSVKGIKFVMNSGQLNVDDFFTFNIPVVAPYDAQLKDAQAAYNSAAVSQDGVIFTEGNISALTINNVLIKGTAFKDYNENSKQELLTEPGIAGVTVHLMMEERNEDGTFNEGVYVPAMNYRQDESGNLIPTTPITAVTDLNGQYRMEAYYAANYYVRFEQPLNHVPTLPDNILNPYGSHLLQNQDQTDIFKVDTSNYKIIRNAGYLYALGDLKITKQVQTMTGGIYGQGTRDVSFEVKIDNQPYTQTNGVEIRSIVEGQPVSTFVTPDANGRFTMKNGNVAWIRSLNLGQSYSVQELDYNLYDSTPADGLYSGTVKQNENPLPFVNKEISNGSLTVTKVLQNGDQVEFTDPNRTFYFRMYGPTYPGSATTGGITFSLKGGESKTFDDLSYGRYYVYEQEDENYNKVTTTTDYSRIFTYGNTTSSTMGYQEVQFTNRTPTITVINRERPQGKLQITKELFDFAGNQNTTDRRYFQYVLKGPSYPNGYTGTIYSNNTSPTSFMYLKYGTYTLYEVNANTASSRYDTTYTHTTSEATYTQENPLELEFTFDTRADVQKVTINNTEKPLGQITVNKYLQNASGTRLYGDTRPFTVKISGENLPVGYAKETLEVRDNQPAIFDNLPYGTYKITEIGVDDNFYTTTYSVSTQERELTFANPNSLLNITNRENDAGEIWLTKELLASDNTPITEKRSFNVRITGPLGSQTVTINNTDSEPVKVTNLRYGTYAVQEIAGTGYNLSDYEISSSVIGSFTLNATDLANDSHLKEITITNKEKDLGQLTIVKQLRDSAGNILPADPGRTFNINIKGPGIAPEGREEIINNSTPLVIDNLPYGQYTITEDVTNSKYDLAASTTTGSATLSIDEKSNTVTLINQEQRNGKITIKKVLLSQYNGVDYVVHTTAREIVMTLEGDNLQGGTTSKILKTGGSHFILNDPTLPAGPRDGIGYVDFGSTTNSPDALAYGSYNISELMPNYTGTEYENNYQFLVTVREGDTGETVADATTPDAFVPSASGFVVNLDVDNNNKTYTIYNRLVVPTDGEFVATKVWMGGKKDTAHAHHGDADLLTLYRRARIVSGETVTLTDPVPVPATDYTLTIEDITPTNAANDPTLDTDYESHYRYVWTGLPAGDTGTGARYFYYVTETTVPEWYTADFGANAISLPIAGNDAQAFVPSGGVIINRYTPPPISLHFDKTWVGGTDARPAFSVAIMRDLTIDGTLVTQVGSQHDIAAQDLADNTPTRVLTVNNLPPNDSFGRSYNYYVKEGTALNGVYTAALPENYAVTFENTTPAEGGSFITAITNTYIPEKGTLTATKTWSFDDASLLLYPNAAQEARQDVWFQLYRQAENSTAPAEMVGTAPTLLSRDAETTITWDNVDLETADAVPYLFTVKEVDESGSLLSFVPLNFTKEEPNLSIATSFNITNTFIPEAQRNGTLSVTKLLEDAAGGRYGENGYNDPLNREFIVSIQGPYGYSTILRLGAGQTEILENLAYGQYTVSEMSISSDIFEPTVYTPASRTVTLSPTAPDGEMIILNKEKALGKLSLSKLLRCCEGRLIVTKRYATDPNDLDIRPFQFKVVGPIYSDDLTSAAVQTHIVSSNSAATVLEGLSLGTYEISEVPDYNNTDQHYNMPEPVRVTLTAANFEKAVELENQEKRIGEITIHKKLTDASGNVITADSRPFWVQVTGDRLDAPRIVAVAANGSTVVDGLPLGKYSVVELDNTAVYNTDYSLISATDPAATTTPPTDIVLSLETGDNTKQQVYIHNQEKAIGSLTLKKEIINTSGTSGSSNPNVADFVVKVTGPGYEKNVSLPADGTAVELNNLSFGTYSFEELASETNAYLLSDYTVTQHADVTLQYNNITAAVTITNTEKPLGYLTIEKVLENALGETIDDQDRRFIITVFGPEYGPEGFEVVLQGTGESTLPVGSVSGLKYGTYSATELANPNYDLISISDAVTLDTTNKSDRIVITNRERALGELATILSVYDAQGNLVNDSREIDVLVFGPSYPAEGEPMTITNGKNLQLSNLIYGPYHVVPQNVDDYIVNLDTPVTLTLFNQVGEFNIRLQEQANAQLDLSLNILDASGNPLPPGRNVTLTVFGPSYPQGRDIQVTTGQPIPSLSSLIYGTYSVEVSAVGQGTLSDYTVDIDPDVELSILQQTGAIGTVLKEKPNGKLDLSLKILDSDGNEITDGRKTTIKVFGPSYPAEGKDIIVTAGQSIPPLTDLVYGQYSMAPINDEGYSVVALDPAVELSILSKSAQINGILAEQADAVLSLSLRILDDSGNDMPPGRSVTLKLFGPSYPLGKDITLITGEPIPVLSSLIYGTYWVEAPAIEGYTLHVPQQITLSVTQRSGMLQTVYTEVVLPPQGKKDFLPKTGDDSNIAAWFVAFVASAAGIFSMAFALRRRRIDEK